MKRKRLTIRKIPILLLIPFSCTSTFPTTDLIYLLSLQLTYAFKILA